jgi:hypothetical protein
MNVALAVGKLAIGIYSMSLFLCVSALYNVGLAYARRVALKGYGKKQAEYQIYRKVGVVLTISGVIFVIYCLRLFLHVSEARFSMYESLAIAAITFSEIGAAVYGVVVTGKGYSPILASIKLTSLASSLVSLVLTQSAILSFTAEGNMAFYNGLSGMIFGGSAALIGVFMTLYASFVIDGHCVPKAEVADRQQGSRPQATIHRICLIAVRKVRRGVQKIIKALCKVPH